MHAQCRRNHHRPKYTEYGPQKRKFAFPNIFDWGWLNLWVQNLWIGRAHHTEYLAFFLFLTLSVNFSGPQLHVICTVGTLKYAKASQLEFDKMRWRYLFFYCSSWSTHYLCVFWGFLHAFYFLGLLLFHVSNTTLLKKSWEGKKINKKKTGQ